VDLENLWQPMQWVEGHLVPRLAADFRVASL